MKKTIVHLFVYRACVSCHSDNSLCILSSSIVDNEESYYCKCEPIFTFKQNSSSMAWNHVATENVTVTNTVTVKI